MTVIGPINQKDWNYAINLRKDIRWMKDFKREGFDFTEAIQKESNLYKNKLAYIRAATSTGEAA